MRYFLYILIFLPACLLGQSQETQIQGRFWLDFPETFQAEGEDLFEDHAGYFGLSAQDEMREFRRKRDEIGFTHFRYQQYHRGYEVDGADCVVHEKNGRVVSVNGRLVCGLNTVPAPAITPTQAITTAINDMSAERWMWEDSLHEAELKVDMNDPQASHYPKPERVWVKPYQVKSWSPDSFRLAYKVILQAMMPLDAKAYFIEVQSGQILRVRPLMPSCGLSEGAHDPSVEKTTPVEQPEPSAPFESFKVTGCSQGTGSTTFNGSQLIYTEWANNTYRLDDDCQSAWIRTRFYSNNVNNSGATDYTDGDNNWTSSNDRMGVSAHWGVKMAQNYYSTIHTRNGWADNGQDVEIYCDYNFGTTNSPNYNNAQWSTISVLHNAKNYYGIGPTNSQLDDYTALDICAHEFTHGVTRSESDLKYEGESGAMNEGFSDFFGEVVESWTTGSFDWLVGGDRLDNNNQAIPLRDMANPKNRTDPDTYGGINWLNPNCNNPGQSNDNCGVHTNSGVLNKMHYILVVGETGFNDSGVRYEVTGIGLNKARAISYRANVLYLSSQDEYIDGREAFIRAANDLYGVCSNESIAVGKAFYAVGVGGLAGSLYNRDVCGTITAPVANNGFSGIRSVRTGGPGCTTNVTPNGSAFSMHAGMQVILRDGFRAPIGSNMQIYTRECDYTKY